MIAYSRRVRLLSTSFKFDSVEVVIWFWIGCTLATLVVSQQNFYIPGRYGKRQDVPKPFILMGSRYGRSGSNTEKDPKSLKIIGIAPRTDRFFLGSRYGKRTSMQMSTVSSVKRFEAVCNYLDRVHRMEHAKQASEDTDFDFEDNSISSNSDNSSKARRFANARARHFPYLLREYGTN